MYVEQGAMDAMLDKENTQELVLQLVVLLLMEAEKANVKQIQDAISQNIGLERVILEWEEGS